jgi:hypothetical protein
MSFWANKISGEPTQQTAPPARDLYGLYNPVSTPVPQPQQQSIPQQDDYKPASNIRLKQGGRCPGCNSDRYMQHGNFAVACGECGYHPRFEQSTYGLPSLADDNGTPAAPARQTGETSSLTASIALLNAGGGQHITNL